MPAKKNNNCITFCRDEAEHKDVLATAVVAFGDSFAQRGFSVQNDLLMLCAHKVVDDMGGRSVSPRVAEPFGADETLDDGGRGVDATIAGCTSASARTSRGT